MIASFFLAWLRGAVSGVVVPPTPTGPQPTQPRAAAAVLFYDDYERADEAVLTKGPGVPAGVTIGSLMDNGFHGPVVPWQVSGGRLRPTPRAGTDTNELYYHGIGTPNIDATFRLAYAGGVPRYFTIIFRFRASDVFRLYYVEHYIDPSGVYAPHPLVMRYADYTPELTGGLPIIDTLDTSDVQVWSGDVLRLWVDEPTATARFYVNGALAMESNAIDKLPGADSFGVGGNDDALLAPQFESIVVRESRPVVPGRRPVWEDGVEYAELASTNRPTWEDGVEGGVLVAARPVRAGGPTTGVLR